MNDIIRFFSACTLVPAALCAVAGPEPGPVESAEPAPVSSEPQLASSPGKNVRDKDVDDEALHSHLIPRDLPYLSVVGRNNKFYIGLGGAVKGTASFDFGHVVDNPNEFIVSAIPMSQAGGDGGKYQVSAQQTELFVTAGFNPGDRYEVLAYVNGRFLGSNYGFQLENAYVSFLGFTVGYGYGLFCDTGAAPNTIDYEGPNALLTVPGGILNYRYSINDRWTVGAGVELPMASFTDASGQTRTVNQRIPDIPVMAQYKLPGGGHISAAVVMRGLQYRDELRSKNRTAFGWGVRLSGTGKLAGPLDFFFQGAGGKGMTSYIQDLNGTGMDMVPCAGTPGELTAVKSFALMGGLQYNFSPKVFATAAYSHVRTYPKAYAGGDTLLGDQYSYGQYAVGNVMWNVTKIVQCGLEYIYGRRVNMDGAQAHDNRIQTMLQVSF